MEYQLGIDLGGTTAKIGIVDEEYKIDARASMPTGKNIPFQAAIGQLAEKIRSLPGFQRVQHIGMGVPSSIEPKRQTVIHANNLGWKKCDVVSELRRFFDAPIYIANDADCAVLGESLCGAAKGCSSVLMLTLGTGVGGGFMLRDKLFCGGNGCGFEPGHMIIVENGAQCTCGRKGCLDYYGSSQALVDAAKRAIASGESPVLNRIAAMNGGAVSAKTVIDACRENDEAALHIWDTYIHSLAIGISNLITLFRPDTIVIGGGISRAGEMLFKPLYELVSDMTYGLEIMGCPPIVPAVLGNDAGLIGAAMLHRFIQNGEECNVNEY